jgi:hypothetical protein
MTLAHEIDASELKAGLSPGLVGRQAACDAISLR